jgi:hypothetical protein
MRAKSIAAFILFVLVTISVVQRARAQANVMAVVVNADNPATNISLSDLRKFFAGEKRSWTGGQPVQLITRGPGCAEHAALLKLLAMSEAEYKQYWTAQVFRGEADAEPLVVPSVGMQKEALKLYPGGISLVNVSDVKPGMKVVKVDGLLPGAAGYPIH